MSAGASAVDVDLDPVSNRATARVELEIADLFDENGELRLWDTGDGWIGFILEDGAYYSVNTCRPSDDWMRRFRVGERAVRLSIKRHIENPDAGGAGVVERGVRV